MKHVNGSGNMIHVFSLANFGTFSNIYAKYIKILESKCWLEGCTKKIKPMQHELWSEDHSKTSKTVIKIQNKNSIHVCFMAILQKKKNTFHVMPFLFARLGRLLGTLARHLALVLGGRARCPTKLGPQRLNKCYDHSQMLHVM